MKPPIVKDDTIPSAQRASRTIAMVQSMLTSSVASARARRSDTIQVVHLRPGVERDRRGDFSYGEALVSTDNPTEAPAQNRPVEPIVPSGSTSSW